VEIEKKATIGYDGTAGKHEAVLAQLVEHLHGKEKVPGSIPGNGSLSSAEKCFSPKSRSRLSSSGRATVS
jgi:hypothetical protein